jgi:hypothetical protein
MPTMTGTGVLQVMSINPKKFLAYGSDNWSDYILLDLPDGSRSSVNLFAQAARPNPPILPSDVARIEYIRSTHNILPTLLLLRQHGGDYYLTRGCPIFQ